jgi:hypothetical protein
MSVYLNYLTTSTTCTSSQSHLPKRFQAVSTTHFGEALGASKGAYLEVQWEMYVYTLVMLMVW